MQSVGDKWDVCYIASHWLQGIMIEWQIGRVNIGFLSSLLMMLYAHKHYILHMVLFPCQATSLQTVQMFWIYWIDTPGLLDIVARCN